MDEKAAREQLAREIRLADETEHPTEDYGGYCPKCRAYYTAKEAKVHAGH